MCRGFEIETISAADLYLVLPRQYKCPFTLLTVYDPLRNGVCVMAMQVPSTVV